MPKDVYIGIDLGSSSVKTIALDASGSCVAAETAALAIQRGPAGVAEQSPVAWKAAAGACLRQLAAKLAQASCMPVGVAATGQMNGPVLLDRAGQPLLSVQMWCDTRCVTQCETIASRVSTDRMLAVTGHTPVTGYTAPKLLWLAEHEPEALRSAAHLVFPKDYLTNALTGTIGSDFSDASNSLLLDIHRGIWDEEIVSALGLGGLGLPTLANGTDVVGRVTKEGSAWSGLPEGIPVAAGVGDSIAAAFGAGMDGPAVLQIVVGSAGNVNCVLDDLVIDKAGRIHTGFYVDSRHWICSGVLQASGASLKWWAEVIGKSVDELLREVDLDKPLAVMFAPYLNGERTPHLDPRVRGAFVKLDTNTTRGDMTRAVLEGMAFALRAAMEVFRDLGIRSGEISLTGGGVRSAVLCRIMADVFDVPLRRVTADVTVRGAALLAACAAGRFAKWQEASRSWPLCSEGIVPEHPGDYEEAYRLFRMLYPHLAVLSTN